MTSAYSAFVQVLSPLASYGVLYLAVENLTLPAGIRRALAVLGAMLLTVAAVRLDQRCAFAEEAVAVDASGVSRSLGRPGGVEADCRRGRV